MQVIDMRQYKARQAALKHIGSNNNVMMSMIIELEQVIKRMQAEIDDLQMRIPK